MDSEFENLFYQVTDSYKKSLDKLLEGLFQSIKYHDLEEYHDILSKFLISEEFDRLLHVYFKQTETDYQFLDEYFWNSHRDLLNEWKIEMNVKNGISFSYMGQLILRYEKQGYYEIINPGRIQHQNEVKEEYKTVKAAHEEALSIKEGLMKILITKPKRISIDYLKSIRLIQERMSVEEIYPDSAKRRLWFTPVHSTTNDCSSQCIRSTILTSTPS